MNTLNQATVLAPPPLAAGRVIGPVTEPIRSSAPGTGAGVFAVSGSGDSAQAWQRVEDARHSSHSGNGGGWHTRQIRRPLRVHHCALPQAQQCLTSGAVKASMAMRTSPWVLDEPAATSGTWRNSVRISGLRIRSSASRPSHSGAGARTLRRSPRASISPPAARTRSSNSVAVTARSPMSRGLSLRRLRLRVLGFLSGRQQNL